LPVAGVAWWCGPFGLWRKVRGAGSLLWLPRGFRFGLWLWRAARECMVVVRRLSLLSTPGPFVAV
jgi:hypothetical protein